MGKGTGTCAARTAMTLHVDQDRSLTAAEQETLQTYQRNARAWATSRGTSDFWADELTLLTNRQPDGRILDVGSGAGRDAVLLRDAGYDVTCLDISSELLDLVAENCPQARRMLGSMYDIPASDGEYDALWVVVSLLHIPRARCPQAAAELRRVLKPGGTMFCAVKEGVGETVEHGELGARHFTFFDTEQLTGMLERAGFSVNRLDRRTAGDTTWLCAYATAR